jgi:hypothetical protein
MHLTVGKQCLSLDMGTGNSLGCTLIGEDDRGRADYELLKPCVLPQWLQSSQVPSSGYCLSHDPCLAHRYSHMLQ